LDYLKVKPSEKETAARLARSAAGAALESDVEQERFSNGGNYDGEAKTFIPGEGLPLDDSNVLKPVVTTAFTVEQKQQIRDLLANASSVKEVEEIESAVRKGILPDRLKRSAENNERSVDDEREYKIQKLS
jgi:hypothetical protein